MYTGYMYKIQRNAEHFVKNCFGPNTKVSKLLEELKKEPLLTWRLRARQFANETPDRNVTRQHRKHIDATLHF
jgi:hypothetical protein